VALGAITNTLSAGPPIDFGVEVTVTGIANAVRKFGSRIVSLLHDTPCPFFPVAGFEPEAGAA